MLLCLRTLVGGEGCGELWIDLTLEGTISSPVGIDIDNDGFPGSMLNGSPCGTRSAALALFELGEATGIAMSTSPELLRAPVVTSSEATVLLSFGPGGSGGLIVCFDCAAA